MKAKFFILGLCALGLVACSIDEVSQMNDSNAIQFKAATATRAASTTTNNLSSFSVWAWNAIDGVTQTTPFMDDVVATKSGSVFTTSPLYFWPTGTVDFYAISPATTLTAVDNGTEYAYIGGSLDTGEDYWKYTGNVARATINGCGDITIEADLPSSAEDHVDICYAVNTKQSSGSVAMNFRHAFSQLVFKAKNTNSAMEIEIQDVSVCSVNKHGTYTLPTFTDGGGTSTNLPEGSSTAAAEGTQGTWAVTTGTQTKFVAGITSTTLKGGDEIGTTVTLTTKGTGYLFVIPQQVVAWDPDNDHTDSALGSYIRVNCKVTENGSQLWPNANETDESGNVLEYAEIAVPVEIDWEQGYRYTYTIVFGDGLGYYAPDDPNSDLDGTPVLDLITFEVTVDEFQDAEEVEVSTDTPIYVADPTSLLAAVSAGYSEIVVTESMDLGDVDDYLEFTQDCTLTLEAGIVITPCDVTEVDDPANISDNQTATSAIHISGGTLTVNAAEGAGIITNGSSSLDTSCFWLNGGSLVINGGTYKGGTWNDPAGTSQSGASATVYVELGYAYIYGGEFYGGWSGSMKQTSLLNCLDSSYNNGTANIYCYGGTYQNFDPAACNSEDSSHTGQTNFCAEGYITEQSAAVDNDGFYWYTVVEEQ